METWEQRFERFGEAKIFTGGIREIQLKRFVNFYAELKDFIGVELAKAREEERARIIKLIDETLNEGWDNEGLNILKNKLND